MATSLQHCHMSILVLLAIAKMKVAIITTTIYVPKALQKYAANAKQFGHSDVLFVVTADKKTPKGMQIWLYGMVTISETQTFCEELQIQSGYTVKYLSVDEQLEYLQGYPELGQHLPWNCIQRRNISLLYAYQQNADVIITIDDDNFIIDGGTSDFIGSHLRIAKPFDLAELSTNTNWFNVCDFLTEERNVPFYHRGYPMGERWKKVLLRKHRDFTYC